MNHRRKIALRFFFHQFEWWIKKSKDDGLFLYAQCNRASEGRAKDQYQEEYNEVVQLHGNLI